MIPGTVTAGLEGVARLGVRGPLGTVLTVDAIIDSGFTASLTLPTATVVALGLSPQSDGEADLADGSVHQFDVYDAEVAWDGRWRRVLVWAMGHNPLVGMQLMAGYRLLMDVVPGGAVEITALP